VQDLLLCAKHLFVAAMVAWVHPGPCRVLAIQNMTAGQSAFGAVKFSGAQKQSAALITLVDPPFIGKSTVL
jgi:CTP:molybdopterin cytidylyltransferase MocA